MAMSASPAVAPVIAVLSRGGAYADVAHPLETSRRTEWYERRDALVQRVSAGGVKAVLVGLEDETGHSIAPTIVEIADRDPSVSVVLYDRIDGATVRHVAAVFGVGLRMECVARPYERLEPVLRRVTSADYRPGVAPTLLARVVSRAPTALQLFATLAAVAVADRPHVEAIAQRCGVSLRTIERRLLRAGWPGAHVVVQSFVALDAAWLMSEYGWSARRVHAVRRFPHASSVTRLLARYAGVRPATFREDGGFPAALEFVERVLSPHPVG